MSIRSLHTMKKHNYTRVDSVGFGEDSDSDLDTTYIDMDCSGENDHGKRELEGDNVSGGNE